MEKQLLFRLKNKIQQKITTDEKEIYSFQNRLRSDKGNVAYKNNAKYICVNSTPTASYHVPTVPPQIFGNLHKPIENEMQPIPNHYQEEEERDISHFPSSVQNLINKRKLSKQNAVKLKPEDIHGTLEELPFLSVVLVEGEGEVNIKNEHINSEDMCVETRLMNCKRAGKRRKVKSKRGRKPKFSKKKVSESETTDSEDVVSDEYCPPVDEQKSVPHCSRSLRKTPRRNREAKLEAISDSIKNNSVSYENMSDTEEDIPKPNS